MQILELSFDERNLPPSYKAAVLFSIENAMDPRKIHQLFLLQEVPFYVFSNN
jgi:hypothetical protein